MTETKDGATSAILQAYTYDKTGNRTSATVGATATTYTYPATSHRLSQVGANARAYDNAGNTTQIAGATAKNFVYGDHNRLTQSKNGTTVAMNYVYNGFGEQVRKYLGSANTYSIYDEAGQWIGDYGNTGATAPAQQVIWFDDLPVGVLVGAGASQKLHYIEPDALGTPRVVVDRTRGASGTAIWAWDLQGEAFGTTAPNQDPDGDATQFVFNMRYPGQRYDAASGLSYNYFRDYDPSTGRYSQSDPITLAGGISTYGYVHGNPMIAIDPLGLARWTGTVRIAYGSADLKFKPFKKLPPIAKKKIEYARVTVSLESDCIKGSKTKVVLEGPIEMTTSSRIGKAKFALYDVLLYSDQPDYQPDYEALEGSFIMNASGYIDVGGTLSVGIASGKITGGKSMLGILQAQGEIDLVPFTRNTLKAGRINCSCEN